MANRRRFIQAGLALSALSLPQLSPLGAERKMGTVPIFPSGGRGVLRLERFVFDVRFPEAAEAAVEAARRAVPVVETAGDLMQLWYHDLDRRWKQAPMALAGVTTRSALFVLETLAADHRMRVIYLGEHAAPKGGRVEHVLTGPAAVTAAAARPRQDDFWTRLGRAMIRCPLGQPLATEARAVTSASGAPARSEPLRSWIIAPRARAASRG